MLHTWHIVCPDSEADLRLAISAARIVIGHTGALILLDADGQAVFALAPSAWLSVERVVPNQGNPAVDSGTTEGAA